MEAGREGEGLRREISLLGSFAMGFADVGADVFLAIGLVAAYAGGYAPLAFLIASLCYVSTGLVYAELTSMYPYAGGAQVFGSRAGGDLLGFLLGWCLLMAYVVDIGLFSIVSVGYLSYVLPQLNSTLTVSLGPVSFEVSLLGLAAFAIVLFLIALNIAGIRESSLFNEIFTVMTLAAEGLVLVLAFALAFDPARFLGQLAYFGSDARMPNVSYTGLLDIRSENFMYGVTIAMSSFIGIASIAQAAEETRNPWRVVPRAFKYSIVAVLLLTLSFSVLGNGVLGWRGLAESVYNPIAAIAARIPVVGPTLAQGIALVAFAINMVSANTGVIGVSRIVYSMGRYRLLPAFLSKLHRTRATPYVSIVIFGLVGGALALTGCIYFVVSLYSFAALLSYVLINWCHIRLRSVERDAYRPWRTPLNVRVGGRELSLTAVVGTIVATGLFALLMVYHSEGRLLGALWVLVGLGVFCAYRLATGEGIRANVSSKLIPPAMRYIRTLVYVPLLSNPRHVAEVIRERLDELSELHLVTVLPGDVVRKLGREELERLRAAQEEVLAEVCRLLRGYRCARRVLVAADASAAVADYMSRNGIDRLVVLASKRRSVKGKAPIIQGLNSRTQVIFISE